MNKADTLLNPFFSSFRSADFGCVLTLSLALLLWPAGSFFAQTERLYFHHLTANEGLSQSVNEFVYKDLQGFVWISSTDGLNRFDGQTVRIYRPRPGEKNSMAGNFIVSGFFEDKSGNIWFGTMQAINCWRRATDDFATYTINTEGRPSDGGYYIFHLDIQNQLWIKTGNRLFLMSLSDSTKAQPVYTDLGKVDGHFNFFLTDPVGMPKRIFSSNLDNVLYVYDYIGGKMYPGKSWVIRDKTGKPGQVNSLYPDAANQRLWASTKNGLFLFDAENGQLLDVFDSFEGQKFGSASALEPLSPDFLFVSTRTGLLLFDITKGKFVRKYRHKSTDPGSLSADLAHNLYVDRTRTLWASFWAAGVDYAHLDKQKFDLVGADDLLVDNETNFSADALAMDAEGDLWIGSNMAPLRKRTGNKGPAVIMLPGGKPHRTSLIKSIGNGDILLACGSGIGDGAFWYDRRNKRFTRIPEPDGVTFIDFYQLLLPDKNILAGSDNGLYKVARRDDGSLLTEKIRTNEPAAFDNTSIQKILQDKEGRLYLATGSRKLFVGRITKGQFVKQAEAPLSGWVNALAEHGEYLWTGGDFGLYRFRKQDFDHQKNVSPDTILSSTVYGILPGNDGNLWLSTNSGLFCLRNDSAQANKFSLRQYHMADGLQGFEYNSNAYQVDSEGRLWFGGISGINYFQPSEVRDLDTLPQVWITGLWVNDQPDTLYKGNVTLHKTLIFSHRQSTLSFEFAALEYSDPAQNRLRYRLKRLDGESPDDDWVYTKDAKGFVRYANLKPGRYIFQMEGANSDGRWNKNTRELSVTITPPFTQTRAFYALCAFAALLLGYFIFRAIVKRQLREKNLQLREQRLQIEKQEALTQERNRIAGEMHDDLGGGLTSIRMLSSRVQKKITNPDLQTQVDKIAQYSQELVQKMGEIIWAMNSNFDTVENLIAYIRRYAVDFLDVSGLRYHIREPEEVPDYAISGERRRNIYLAVKESLHNVVKHAEAERVSISFDIKDEQLTVQVQDDGEGIDLEKINEFGNGLFNMRKRLRDIGGDMLVENLDGTLLTFTIPLEKSEES